MKFEENIPSEYTVIAESKDHFRIELMKKVGIEDQNQLIYLSMELEEIFGPHSQLSENKINKYFNESNMPFIARNKGEIIGYIIGIPLEKFSQESWSHYDTNLGKNNTLYTHAFVFKKLYRKKGAYAKTLKRVYINWARKKGYNYITGHVSEGISKKFSSNIEIVKLFPTWYGCKKPFEYYRRQILSVTI